MSDVCTDISSNIYWISGWRLEVQLDLGLCTVYFQLFICFLNLQALTISLYLYSTGQFHWNIYAEVPCLSSRSNSYWTPFRSHVWVFMWSWSQVKYKWHCLTCRDLYSLFIANLYRFRYRYFTVKARSCGLKSVPGHVCRGSTRYWFHRWICLVTDY